MSETLLGQLVWPIVVVLLVLVFYRQLRDAMNQLQGFVSRSHYGESDGRDGVAVSEVWCPIDEVCCCARDDKILDVLREMERHDYSFVPILENGCVVGVLSTKSLLRRSVKGQFALNENLTVAEFLGKCSCEFDLDRFRFTRKGQALRYARENFREDVRNGHDFPLVFVTKNGSPKSKLLGVVSVWDVAVKDN